MFYQSCDSLLDFHKRSLIVYSVIESFSPPSVVVVVVIVIVFLSYCRCSIIVINSLVIIYFFFNLNMMINFDNRSVLVWPASMLSAAKIEPSLML